MDYFLIYLITVSGSLKLAAAIISLLAGIGTVIFGLNIVVGEENNIYIRKLIKRSLIIFFICISIAVLTPTTRHAVLIYVAPKIINSEQVKKLPINILKLINDMLEKESEEKLDR